MKPRMQNLPMRILPFCMAMTPEAEQLLPVLQRYGFETLEKLAVLG